MWCSHIWLYSGPSWGTTVETIAPSTRPSSIPRNPRSPKMLTAS